MRQLLFNFSPHLCVIYCLVVYIILLIFSSLFSFSLLLMWLWSLYHSFRLFCWCYVLFCRYFLLFLESFLSRSSLSGVFVVVLRLNLCFSVCPWSFDVFVNMFGFVFHWSFFLPFIIFCKY